jgi:hypothetical protein
MPDDTALVRAENVLEDVEAQWTNQRDIAAEAELSINDWAGRVQGAVQAAHAHCRAGNAMEEYTVWAEIAAMAASRMFILDTILEAADPTR